MFCHYSFSGGSQRKRNVTAPPHSQPSSTLACSSQSSTGPPGRRCPRQVHRPTACRPHAAARPLWRRMLAERPGANGTHNFGSSAATFGTFVSQRNTFPLDTTPTSPNTRAHVRSSGAPRLRNWPETGHDAEWSPSASKSLRQARHCAGVPSVLAGAISARWPSASTQVGW